MPKHQRFNKIAILGLGLMGGSIAASLKRLGICQRISAYDVNPEALKEAFNKKLIDSFHDTLSQTIEDVDLIIISTPVDQYPLLFTQIAAILTHNQILTDVGSTKSLIVKQAQEILREKIHQFVPAHPIAGSHKSGVGALDPTLFEKAQIILTPLAKLTRKEAIEEVTIFWQNLNANVTLLDPNEHDAIFALTSHLPQALSYAFLSTCFDESASSDFYPYTGGGFRDIARIGASDLQMWRSIFLSNKTNVVQAIEKFSEHLVLFKQAILEHNPTKLEEMIRKANQIAASFN